MKRFSILAAALFMLAACASEKKDGIVLKFEVENMTASEVAVLLDRTTNYRVELDKEGKGEIALPQKTCIYPAIAYGQEMMPVFIGKDEEVTISFSSDDFHKGVAVSGRNAAASEYLQSMILPDMMQFDQEFPEFKNLVEKNLQSSLDFMKSRGLEESCPEFAVIEKERLSYIFAQAYIMYPMGYAMAHELDDFVPSEEYYETLSSFIEEKPELENVDAYRAFMQFAIPALLEHQGTKISNGLERTVATMKYIGGSFQNEALKQGLLRMLAIDQIQNSGVAGTGDMMKLVKAYVTQPEYLEEIDKIFEESNPVSKGHLSPDFKAVDMDGKEFSLDDFKGKYLYIDLWATWCGPCRNEMPHMKTLEEKFSGKEITFLGLSVDQNKEDWKKMVLSGALSGKQLWLGNESPFLEAYAVKGIPRFILLDKEGKIINANMLRPSSEDTANLLSDLEGI